MSSKRDDICSKDMYTYTLICIASTLFSSTDLESFPGIETFLSTEKEISIQSLLAQNMK